MATRPPLPIVTVTKTSAISLSVQTERGGSEALRPPQWNGDDSASVASQEDQGFHPGLVVLLLAPHRAQPLLRPPTPPPGPLQLFTRSACPPDPAFA
ncbi:hypothetical protein D623_10019743 [Myotis brandtii]|uniref:Uncharacterized protein n=1 Tax=Myotis brandtii TaxID=109478 RepID=S7QCR4_MYOBR|nr:hypothetical protein D623_10019743 [Myotis brandtii]